MQLNKFLQHYRLGKKSPSPERSSASTLAPSLVGREAEAQRDLEQTSFGPGAAWGITLLFIASLLIVPLVHLCAGWRVVAQSSHTNGDKMPSSTTAVVLASLGAGATDTKGGDPQSSWHFPTASNFKEFEHRLEQNSPAQDWVVPRAQSVLLRLGGGNEQVCIGRDQWLMYRPDVEYLTGPGFLDAAALRTRAQPSDAANPPVQPNPLKAIVAFRDQLALRGIQLVLLPTPLKPMVQPEKLYPLNSPPTEVLQNVSYREFCQSLAERGILVCDPSATLFAAKERTGTPQFLRADTHWTPAAMDATADYTAQFLQQHTSLPVRHPLRYGRVPMMVANRGDIAGMLKIPSSHNPFPLQEVRMQQVHTPDGGRWRADSHADVLLLGDSFTNIYSRNALGWGEGGGLGEQLSFYLQRPLDVIAVNAGGASATRRRLRDDFLRGQDRLTGKRVVIWQFAMRDLAQGDWQQLDLSDTHVSTPPALRSVALPNWKAARAAREKPPLQLVRSSQEFLHALNMRVAQKEAEKWAVLPGDQDWLFPMLDTYYSTTPGFFLPHEAPEDAPQVRALVDLQRQLAQRGIRLLVMPLPPKTMIHPEHLGLEGVTPSDAQTSEGTTVAVAQNPCFDRYKATLETAGITVFDPTITLLQTKRTTSAPLFVPGDAHWSFVGMDAAAQGLAEFIQEQGLLPERPPINYVRHAAQVQHTPDLWRIQARATGEEFKVIQAQTVQRVYNPNGEHLSIRPSPDSDVLLLGDSFANIYSHGGPWGTVSGLAEQLSYYLQRPVNRISMEGGAVNTTREELRDRMLRGEDPLAGKKLVIYEFTSRALMSRKWKKIALPPPSADPTPNSPGLSATPQSSAPIMVQGQVVSVAPAPDASRAPYPDLVIAVHLKGARSIGAGAQGGIPSEVLVYTWGMRDHTLTPAASWSVGEKVTLRLIPWAQADEEYGSYNRADLEDEGEAKTVARLPAYWGEVVKP